MQKEIKDMLKDGKLLVLKTVDSEMRAFADPNFIYPREGVVCARDWKANGQCGKGLHGLAWGIGDQGLFSEVEDAVWLIIDVDLPAA